MNDLPPRRLMLGELATLTQALGGRLASLAARPRGAMTSEQPMPLLVIPGFMSGDWATGRLREALTAAGYRSFGWCMGWNLGARADTLDRIGQRVDAIMAETGQRPALIGWSLGGIYAREFAKYHPDRVARVITLGSPFSGSRRANHAWKLYRMVAGHDAENPPVALHPALRPTVPTFALWSPRDGIVAPHSARGTAEESDRRIEVDCTHIGFASSPIAAAAILSALAEHLPTSADPAQI